MKKTLQTTARGWLDGSTQTFSAQMFRAFATLVAAPYSGVVRLRNRLYDRALLRASEPPRPTISVGNLTLGGVGKTPFVGWLADYFLQTSQTPAFISRGYQAERQRDLFARLDDGERAPSVSDNRDGAHFSQFQHFNDEARELALLFPSTPHFLGSNRVEVASALVEARPDVDVLLLDDAFQHRRVKRRLDVVVLDALNPFGGGRVFPAGFLREPIAGLARADVVLLNRADLVSPERRQSIRAEAKRAAPDALFAEIAQTPRFIFSRFRASDSVPAPDATDRAALAFSYPFSPQSAAPSSLSPFPSFAPPCSPSLIREDFASWVTSRRGRRFLAFCGLGAPNGFRKTLEVNGLTPSSFVAFPDHHAYSTRDFEALAAEAERVDAEAILTTAKDFVKLSAPTLAGRPIFALGIGVAFLSGESALRLLLAERFPSRR